MLEHIKKEWVRRLRSGNWTQIKGMLRSGPKGRCCLGVLCDVLQKEGIGKWDSDLSTFINPNVRKLVPYDRTSSELSIVVSLLRKIKLTEKKQNTLVCMNDSRGKTFKQIADYIEKNL